MSGNKSKNIKRKRLSLEKDMKLMLIDAVKRNPVIWDLTNKKHCDAAALKCTWKAIGWELQMEAHECKSAWASLRDSYRYQQKAATAKRIKNGWADEEGLEGTQQIDWEFAPYMSFVPNGTRKKTENSFENLEMDDMPSTSASSVGYTYSDEQTATGNDELENLSVIDGSKCESDAFYAYDKTSKRSKDNGDNATKKLLAIIEKFLGTAETQAPPPAPSPFTREFMPHFIYWDNLLQKIMKRSPESCESVQLRVTQMLITELSEEI